MRNKLQLTILGALVGAGLPLSVASAETYHVNLVHSSVVQGTELKAGDHKMDFKEGQLLIRNGKQTLDVPVSVEKAGQTFRTSMVVYRQDRGTYAIEEIQLGGTKTKLVFNSQTSANSTQ
jgi:hypothetical protein